MISFSEPKSYSAPLFNYVNLLHLDDIFKLQILSFAYQWSHRPLPPCFNEYFKFTSPVGSYSTRQSCNGKLYVASESFNTTQYGVRSLKFTGSRLWNSLLTCITKTNSLSLFQSSLKNLVIYCYIS